MNKFKGLTAKGFTIIELVVVIAIIAILAAIVLIGISGYIKKSQDASLKENMHTVQTDVISNATTGTGLSFTYSDPCDYVAANPSGTPPTPEHGTEAWDEGVKKLQNGTGLAVCASNSASATKDKFCACVQELADPSKYICIDTNKLIETSTSCLAACTATGSLTCP
ncbi:MAG: hypothetical protein A2358_04320 [Candidatus Staskawiczbacteria bacterium RIFOXYB1_FULL_37_44]|uniref:Prepilin-type N-terminal cleavage/methylation domain-containing protein n=1 Tax=Candidatus Staskawiczbacteria bacterium RIFOXYB1_FULL_37_44 TaxID=1802223 RepID=A0A1G2IXA5_9BACT|nr:MAG: hypothetical protein A2358_04320 [Candidatus Staskawiczbacteria bacterium RIFOXYB1_FULL_37_44]OGZ84790.1 MAG: hypothetical protein A2416_00550 [Candidatus Staskawiczbacteria bacterium RIFOXYC1_FULL_37_52]OGZ88078.1 MAG: hypothetical protein A2444_00335 [Candidatus Staskawiczbacteria bacterium RIFOXYC2_FULL_37_19]OGZ90404.1 MAG: hypothetical protein A2581_03490 [Candidatus Staskawiczbacteria bacterium RIFOXYD1_FULL_37_110]